MKADTQGVELASLNRMIYGRHSEKIGEEITETQDYKPGSLFVKRIIRSKYKIVSSDSAEAQILIAPLPERPLPKAIAEASLLSLILIDKYRYHMPLYRQIERFKEEKMHFPYSTFSNWVKGSIALLTPLYDLLKKQITEQQGGYLQADETPVRVLNKNKKKVTHRGYYWIYRDAKTGQMVFVYEKGRGREGPTKVLENFTGDLQSDGYAAYDLFSKKEGINHLQCLAHARRKYYDCLTVDKAREEYALAEIAKVYLIEQNAKKEGIKGDSLKQLRQQQSRPLLEALGKWMETNYKEVLPKGAIGKALDYSLSRRKELMKYTEDGQLEIDNNEVERAIRPTTLGRKNYLFVGGHEAAQRGAVINSLLGSCQSQGVPLYESLSEVLQRIGQMKLSELPELLPENWIPARKEENTEI